jgi:DNA (cytosine-5-)-methyltransferase
MELLPEIQDGSVDMVLCDMPYGSTQNTWDQKLPLDKLWEQYSRIVKEHGAICLFADGMFLADLMKSNRKMWRYNLIWDKVIPTGFLNANRMPLRRTEEIAVFYRKQPLYHPQKVPGKPNHSKGRAVGNRAEFYRDRKEPGGFRRGGETDRAGESGYGRHHINGTSPFLRFPQHCLRLCR